MQGRRQSAICIRSLNLGKELLTELLVDQNAEIIALTPYFMIMENNYVMTPIVKFEFQHSRHCDGSVCLFF